MYSNRKGVNDMRAVDADLLLEKWNSMTVGRTEFDQVIMTTPSIKPEWIPCNKQLPTNSGGRKYIITQKYIHKYLHYEVIRVMRDCYYYYATDCPDEKITDGFYYWDGEWKLVEGEVLAWMPQLDIEPYNPNLDQG